MNMIFIVLGVLLLLASDLYKPREVWWRIMRSSFGGVYRQS
jgi:hypothetical protein